MQRAASLVLGLLVLLLLPSSVCLCLKN